MKSHYTKYKIILFLIVLHSGISNAKTLEFSNLTWVVRDGYGGAGPNYWSNKNAWVDPAGKLHLKISYTDGKWKSAEIFTQKKFGFGKYDFYLEGKVDDLDANVVLGLFSYGIESEIKDITNEIDIELSRWGATKTGASNISYTVWPTQVNKYKTNLNYTFQLEHGDYATFGYIRKKHLIYFQSSYGHYANYDNLFSSWCFFPKDYEEEIPQGELPVHINLWLMNGTAPMNKKEIEVIIDKFCFESPQVLSTCSVKSQPEDKSNSDKLK